MPMKWWRKKSPGEMRNISISSGDLVLPVRCATANDGQKRALDLPQPKTVFVDWLA
jgi:hypothetical protein